MVSDVKAISKVLSANDLGLTGGHQAGILVPKRREIQQFFPPLDRTVKNPRTEFLFKDSSGQRWNFSYIYYNNALFGGTRNEYRLTGMTAFFRTHNLKPGDTLVLSRSDSEHTISCSRAESYVAINGNDERVIIKLSDSWKVISL